MRRLAEIWAVIIGYEKYFISSYGRVKSFNQNKKGKLLKPTLGQPPDADYYSVKLYNSLKVCKTIKVHRLVAQAFIPNPNNLPEVNHIDNDRTNNYFKNLEWVTRKGNCEHAARQKRYNVGRGEKNQFSVLTDKKVRAIRSIKNSTLLEIATQFGISQSTVHQVRSFKTWKHI